METDNKYSIVLALYLLRCSMQNLNPETTELKVN